MRLKLLKVAKEGTDSLYEEEVEMLSRLPVKMPHFDGDGISIDYLDPDGMEEEGWETAMIIKELMLPCPRWAQPEELLLAVGSQREEEADSIFGTVEDIEFGDTGGRRRKKKRFLK